MLVSFLVGCAAPTAGTNFDPTLAQRLTGGVSTIADASALIGPPAYQTVLKDGRTQATWTYVSSEGRLGLRACDYLGECPVDVKRLDLFFDQQGRLILDVPET